MRRLFLAGVVLLLGNAAWAGDLTGRAIFSYQSYGAPQYTSDGFNQLYDLRFERQVTDPFHLRLSLRAENTHNGTDLGAGRDSHGATQLQPGGELLYTIPRFEAQALYDRTSFGSTGIGVPDGQRTLERRLGRLTWSPERLPSVILTSEQRGTSDPLARVDQTETIDQGIVSYTWRTLTASGTLRRTNLDDGGQSFKRSTLERQAYLAQEGSYFRGRLTTSLTANLGNNVFDDRAGSAGAAVPNPVAIAQAQWVVDETPMDDLDHAAVAVPALNDGTLDAPTQIQLGPEGNSFHNLIVDLGRTTDLDTIRVLVRDAKGQLLPIGGSVTFDAYTSTDGVRWSSLAGAFSTFQPALSLYEVRFPSTRSRWFKVVSFSTNAIDTRVSELQAFFTTQLGPNEMVRTDYLLGSGTASIAYRPTDKVGLTYYGNFNTVDQTSVTRPELTSHGFDHLYGLELVPLRVMSFLVRYEDRTLSDSSGFDQAFHGLTGDVQFRFLPSMQQTIEVSRLNEDTAGRRNATSTLALRTYTRLYDTWDLTLNVGKQQQDYADLGFKSDQTFLGGVSQAQLTKALKVILTAGLQHTTRTGSLVLVRPEDTALAPEKDERWTVELYYRNNSQLGISGRWGQAHTTETSAFLQTYHLDWYPFPGGNLRLGAQYDQDLDSLGRRQARRLMLTPAWTINRHVLLNLNYTLLGVTGPQAGHTRSFFVTLTVTS